MAIFIFTFPPKGVSASSAEQFRHTIRP